MRRNFVPAGSVLLLLAGVVGGAASQERALDFSFGRWYHEAGGHADTYTASLQRPLFASFGYGLGFVHVDDRLSVRDRSQSGGELSLVLNSDQGLYGIASGGLGLTHNDGTLDASWSAGGGYAVRALNILRLGLEARYRVEDVGRRGFWQLDPSDRRGLQLQASVAIRLGGGPARPRSGATTVAAQPPAPSPPPSTERMVELAEDGGTSRDNAAVAAAVVETALDAMGTPYQWGGTDSNGFDCSGLIQYAYGQHRILLPRVSRDQIRQGSRVAPRPDQLRPGDILGFSVEGSGVSHVGMYVGDGQFIHSSSQGVRLSSLTASDGNSRWWQDRWVSARRILN